MPKLEKTHDLLTYLEGRLERLTKQLEQDAAAKVDDHRDLKVHSNGS